MSWTGKGAATRPSQGQLPFDTRLRPGELIFTTRKLWVPPAPLASVWSWVDALLILNGSLPMADGRELNP